MKPLLSRLLDFGVCLAAFLGLTCAAAAQPDDVLRYNRDVRPILAEKCFACHGPDAASRQADLRLDEASSAHAVRDDVAAIVAGRPDSSELVRRIEADAGAGRMPPADAARQLSPEERALLRKWVEQGGGYEPHWSLVPPARPAIPSVQNASWVRNPIDAFVLRHLEDQNGNPSPDADSLTLLRRVTLDLTGLPPTPDDLHAFLADESPDAYESLVDRLLASPRCGERLAQDWLDGARFADSGGYQGDIFRTMWPWRDWVIAAFNRNMPFDQFTREQIAGDLLPNPAREQLIATGFHRNHRINDEDGIIPEEFRVEYVVDRVETTASVWLGLTMGCARCHDHKYDPISQADFYRFFAFFNSIDESGRGHGNAPPVLRLTTLEQERQVAEAEQELASLNDRLQALGDDADAESRQGLTQQIESVSKQKEAILAAAPVTMILRELPAPRDTFVLVRGAYDKPGERVAAGLPASLPPLPPGAPANRLGLAQWLVDPANPLTARVTVNRYWQLMFGTGLVATPEDFGTQGELPSHPELLDYLAMEFVESGWDVKRLLRLIATSSAYRQSSKGSAELFAADPDNRGLARGPRYRLPAETLRDQALAAAGLLDHRLGGPSVFPYQPDGLWRELASAGQEYPQSHGADLYRPSMYTFWRRTVHHPVMAAFDAPAREVCALRRPRTNTPMQALALWNEPGFVEASRKLGERVLREAAPDVASRARLLFRLVLARSPTPAELEVLCGEWRAFEQRYAQSPDDATRLLSVGESPRDEGLSVSELAAATAVANLILNLDEAVTKE